MQRKLKEQIRYGLITLLAISLLPVILWLLKQSQGISPEQHARALSDLNQIERELTQVHESIFEIRTGLQQNYDQLTSAALQLRQHTEHYQSELTPEVSQYIAPQLKALNELVATKLEDTDEFKSYSAILRNSTHYIPFATENAINNKIAPSQMCYQLSQALLSYLATSSATERNQIELLVVEIKKLMAKQNITNSLLLSHTQQILFTKQKIDLLISADRMQYDESTLNALRARYTTYYAMQEQRANKYRNILATLTIALILLASGIFLRLTKLSRQLQHSLYQLNFQKYALDQHAIVSITDTDGRITYANSKFCELSGYTEAELLGKKHNIIRSDEHPDHFFQGMWQTISKGHVWRGEIKNKDHSGQPYWVRSTIVPFVDEDNHPFQYVAIRTDISDQKRIEFQLKQSIEQTKGANEAKSRFLATMTHELRTPLNAILGMLQSLSDGTLDSKQRQQIDIASHSGRMLLTLINDILDFSKLESGKVKLEKTPCNPIALVEDTCLLLADLARSKGLKLSCDLFGLPEGLYFEGDAMRLQQILVNLLSNAIKFTQEGGVSVRAELLEQQLYFHVSDTGIGISSEQLPHLFQPFSQADSSTTRKFGGTGLGLSISKKLAEAMRGNLTVKSEPGKGATFCLNVPITPLHQEPTRKLSPLHQCLLYCPEPEQQQRLVQQLERWHVARLYLIKELFQLPETLEQYPNVQLLILATDQLSEAQQYLIEHYPIRGALLSQNRNILQPKNLKLITPPFASSALFSALQIDDSANPKSSQTKIHFHGKRFLLAEDNLINQMVVQDFLEETGVELDMVENGEEALQAIQQKQYDLVLMDQQMPAMDGLTATRHIRALGEHFATVPIIALTANALEQDRINSIEAGMSDYLAKPINKKELLEMLKQWLDA